VCRDSRASNSDIQSLKRSKLATQWNKNDEHKQFLKVNKSPAAHMTYSGQGWSLELHTGVCMNMVENVSSSPCFDVIDYSFYVPSSMTLLLLNERAGMVLSNSIFSILTPVCIYSLKKLICSQIFKRCPNILSTDGTSEWMVPRNMTGTVLLQKGTNCTSNSSMAQMMNLSGDNATTSACAVTMQQTISVSLPYKRTCKSVCDDVSSSCFDL
jgi:hypothetical protein